MRKIIHDTLWMARRYADGRSAVSPYIFNSATAKAIELGIIDDGYAERGITLKDNVKATVWAKDGMFGWPLDHIKKHGCHEQ